MFSLKELLENHGHEVIIFSMDHPKNFDCKYSKYFVSHIDYAEEVKNKQISSGIKVLRKTLFSGEAKKKIEALIREEKPDIAHLHNIHHHITPSILYVLKRNNIPIVWTLHDYTIICPNTSFIDHGRICERCRKRKYYWPLFTRCKKGSFTASTVAAFETVLHRIMGVYNMVDVFITPSKFLMNKFIEFGFPNESFVHLDHFIDFPVVDEEISTEDYYLFVGRIAEEKGVKTLINAAVKVNRCHLKIAGGGPLLNEMVAYVKQKDKNGIVEFLGHKSRKELRELYKKCKFIVVPSEWYENAGLIIFEAYAFEKPVIGAQIGGIPEFVKDNETGLTFAPGNKDDLSQAIRCLLDNPERAATMGMNAKKYLIENHGAEGHYQEIMKIYERVLSKAP
jgi:glycosyltransferase involved in cell wall biosynthesis